MKKITHASFVMGFGTLANIVFGVARAKVSALVLGVVGVGYLAQANLFITFLTTLCSFALASGTSSYLAEALGEKSQKKYNATLYLSLKIQLIATSIFLLIAFIASNPLALYIFQTEEYKPLFFVLLLTIPFTVAYNGFFYPLFMGNKDYSRYTKAMILNGFIVLFFFVSLVYFYKLEGAIISILIGSVITFVIFVFWGKKYYSVKEIASIYKEGEREINSWGLIKFGITNFSNSALNLLTFLLVRTEFIKKVGVAANGLYQVVFSISSYYQPFLTKGVWGHFYPSLSAATNNKERNKLLNDTLRFFLTFTPPIICLLLLVGEYLILLLFSKDFLNAKNLLTFQLSGDYFFLLSYVYSTSLLAQRRLKIYLFLNGGASLVFLFLFFLLADITGIKAIVTIHFLSNCLLFLSLLIYHVKELSMKPDGEVIVLFLYGVVFISANIFLLEEGYEIVKFLLIVCWFFLTTTHHQRSSFYEMVLGKLKVIKR
ncbi:MAG: hypothetical protein HQK84_05100 [Nitrospinae bacterium]|nr:hypothetical protein [Nitrospinota bacterium]